MNRKTDILNTVQQQLRSKAQEEDFTKIEDTEEESPEMEMMEYKMDFYEMSVGSLGLS